MSTHADTKLLEQAAKEMVAEVARAKRKLLEFEVLMSRLDVQAGRVKHYKTAAELLKKLT